MRILERNFRRGRNGEIDIIGRDGKYLVFVEVKYRSGDEKGNAAEAVTTANREPFAELRIITVICIIMGRIPGCVMMWWQSRGRHFTGFQMLFRIIIVQGVRKHVSIEQNRQQRHRQYTAETKRGTGVSGIPEAGRNRCGGTSVYHKDRWCQQRNLFHYEP